MCHSDRLSCEWPLTSVCSVDGMKCELVWCGGSDQNNELEWIMPFNLVNKIHDGERVHALAAIRFCVAA